VAIKLSSLFLIDPGSLLKLYGFSQRGLIIESAGEKNFKRWERILSGKLQATPALLTDMIKALPSENPLTKELGAAAAGDEEAAKRLSDMGSWEACLFGMSTEGKSLTACQQFIVSIERACRRPQQLLEQGSFTDAASMLASDELLSLFLWPEALSVVETAKTRNALLPLRASAALEVHLSILAAMDAQSGPQSVVRSVLPSGAQPGCNPTKLFFRYLREEVGVSTIQGLVDHKQLKSLSLDITTLKRWSAGTHHPDRTWLTPIVQGLWGDANYAPVWERYWAAKYLNYLGYISQTVSERAQKLVGTNTERAAKPWPNYPFGHSCFEEWVGTRYPIWFRYHQRRLSRCH